MKKFEGKVVIVTGAASGLGRAYALEFAKNGAKVLVNDLKNADVVVEEIRAFGGQAIANNTPIGEWEAAQSIIDQAIKAFGRLDILINNAGIGTGGSIIEIDKQGLERMISINLVGQLALCHFAAKHWNEKGKEAGRAIINVSSPAGTGPFPGLIGYVAAKSALASSTIAMAGELAHLGVRVNAIAPMARTPMSLGGPQELIDMMDVKGGFDRFAPENLAPVIAFLASVDCPFTGRVVGLDGERIYMHDNWNVSGELSSNGKQWTQENLISEFAKIPAQQDCKALCPLGIMEIKIPSEETLQALS